MTGSEMAVQLEKVAEGARNGNAACLAVAREMLAARRMLEALQHYARDYDHHRGCSVWDGGYIARDAIAAAKGENNGQ